jgi:hypothetical protein
MAARIFPEGRARSTEDFRTVAGLRDWLSRTRHLLILHDSITDRVRDELTPLIMHFDVAIWHESAVPMAFKYVRH